VRSSSGPTGDGKISASSGSRTNERSTAAPSGTPAMKRRYLSRSPHSSAVTLYLSWTSSLIRGQSRALSLRKPALPAAEELLLTWGVGRLGVEACVEPTRARLCVAAMLAGEHAVGPFHEIAEHHRNVPALACGFRRRSGANGQTFSGMGMSSLLLR
jgi:hypothetical protein